MATVEEMSEEELITNYFFEGFEYEEIRDRNPDYGIDNTRKNKKLVGRSRQPWRLPTRMAHIEIARHDSSSGYC